MRRKRQSFVLSLGAMLLISLGLVNPAPASAFSWVLLNSSCVDGGVSGWSFYNYCYGRKQAQSDGNPNRDYYSHRMTISANATNGKFMSKTWVEPYPAGNADPMTWHGTDPFKPDQTVFGPSQSCTTTSLEVGIELDGVFKVSWGSAQTVCTPHEEFGPKLYAQDGHHAGVWQADPGWRADAGTVKKAFTLMVVRLAQGGFASWNTTRHGANTHYTQVS